MRVLNYLRHESEQRERIKTYLIVRSGLDDLFLVCQSARFDVAGETQSFSILPAYFEKLVAAFQEAILLIVDAECREELLAQAARSGLQHSKRLRDMEFLAKGELTLRSLLVICLQSASREWPSETRLPQWKRLFETAKAELQSAVEEWKEFKKQWKPQRRTRRKPR